MWLDDVEVHRTAANFNGPLSIVEDVGKRGEHSSYPRLSIFLLPRLSHDIEWNHELKRRSHETGLAMNLLITPCHRL